MVKNLVDVNERLLDNKGGIYGFKEAAPNISYHGYGNRFFIKIRNNIF
jgi:hypothetical protein